MSAPRAGGKLELRGILLHAGGRTILSSLDLTVAPGEVATLMGPSGCGKSSLLAYVCGTLDPGFAASGRIVLDGHDVTDLPPERRRIGILFQDDLLFPHLTVAENLAFGLLPEPRDRRARRALVADALSEAGLAGFGGRDPATLSGGQRARVALLRTLLAQPRALLLDEPFAKLDVGLRKRFRRFVFAHVASNALPTLLVTHDPADVPMGGGPVIEIGPARNGAAPDSDADAEGTDTAPPRSPNRRAAAAGR